MKEKLLILHIIKLRFQGYLCKWGEGEGSKWKLSFSFFKWNFCVKRVHDIDPKLTPVLLPEFCNMKINLITVIRKIYLNPVKQKIYMNSVRWKIYLNPVIRKIYMNSVIRKIYLNPIIRKIYLNPVMRKIYLNPVIRKEAGKSCWRDYKSTIRIKNKK